MNLDGSTQYFVGGKQVVLIIHIDGGQVLVSINMNLDGSTQYFVGGSKLSLSSTSMVAKSLSP